MTVDEAVAAAEQRYMNRLSAFAHGSYDLQANAPSAASGGPWDWNSALYDYPVFVALANAALPADSPYKITRADVEWIELAIKEVRRWPMEPLELMLTGLRMRLSALLPP